MNTIKEGKLSTDQLKKLIFKHTSSFRSEVLSHPYIGEDCAFLDAGDNILTVSSDPITAASDNIGELAVMININDIAASGADPFAMTVTLLCPLGTSEHDIDTVMGDISSAAGTFKVQIIGGHTEITSSVNKMIVSVTALGLLDRNYYESLVQPSENYNIYMTKTSGIEGTYIIANEKMSDLANILTEKDKETIGKYKESITVLEDARLARKYLPVMHDITEGGVLGAVYEMCELFGLGAKLFKENIPVSDTTKKICSHYGIDPLRLISSGSLLIFADEKHHEDLLKDFKKCDIDLSLIGNLTGDKDILILDGDKEEEVRPPSSDEIYKVL